MVPDITFQKRLEKDLEFEIFSLQDLFQRQSRLSHPLNAPHRVHFFMIFFITAGQGAHFIDFQSYSYQPGTLFFISKGQVHSFEVRAENDAFLILFTEEFLQRHIIQAEKFSFYRIYNYHLFSPVIQPESEMQRVFSDLFRSIQQEYTRAQDFVREEILACLLKLLLLQAERIKTAMTPQIRHTSWYHTFLLFKHALETQYIETRNACDYAEILHVSYKHLNTICKEFTSLSAKQFIDRWMILEMKRKLASTPLSVKEIAYQSGFDDPTNFVKFFKHRTSQSPTQFRHSLKLARKTSPI